MKSDMPEREVVVSSLLYLLTRYSQTGEEKLAKAIYQHFEILHRHPETSEGCLLNTCRRLQRSWQRIVNSGAKCACFDTTGPASSLIH
jgi:rhamnogalacturonyl hydrolase YesR